jgi:hypothetical protein
MTRQRAKAQHEDEENNHASHFDDWLRPLY